MVPSPDPGGPLEPLIFRADFNCPFCFAQNERIATLGLSTMVELRPAEHAPQLSVPAPQLSGPGRAELDDELARLRERAPEVECLDPRIRPNTGPAIALLAGFEPATGTAVHELRDAIFRSLWIHAHDISQPRVLDQIAQRFARSGTFIPTLGQVQAARWQSEWENGAYERRIPVLESAQGVRLLGMQSARRLELFFASGKFGAVSGESC